MAEASKTPQPRPIGSVLGHARRTLAMVAEVDRGLLIVLLVCQVLDALSLVAIAWVGKQIVDAIVAAIQHKGTLNQALFWVGLELGLVVARSLVSRVQEHAQVLMRSKLGLHVNLLVIDKAARVSYARFEDPEFMDAMTRARREASSRPLSLVNQALVLVRHFITLVGFAALLFSLGPWAVLVIVAAAVPPFFAEARHGRKTFAMQKARSMRNRRLFYLEAVLTTEQTVKEVKLFSLASFLRERYRDIHVGYHEEESQLSAEHARFAFFLGILASLALYGAYGVIVMRTVAGAITLGAMTLYMSVLRQGQSTFQGALGALARAYEDDLFKSNLFEFLAVEEDEPDAAEPLADVRADKPPRIEFRDVSFQYPNSAKAALSNVNLVVEPGQTFALVGKNGAGKTTLIKLLVGLHRPTSGQILIDGVDSATMTASEVRRRIGVIFQDFSKFQLSARENVGVGWLPSMNDDAAIGTAVDDAGARPIVERLPQGLETPLGRAFGGDDLSGGQWQRVALARAFLRRSGLLVLDEPTAAMDAEAEHEIFQRFRDLKAGRTAILVTHRFSTVRMADRIVVFEDGKIVEEGTHAALIAENGRYATMFNLQAKGYALDA
jgi:ABC-type multidrug transport system fused ATPase/permease subunit